VEKNTEPEHKTASQSIENMAGYTEDNLLIEYSNAVSDFIAGEKKTEYYNSVLYYTVTNAGNIGVHEYPSSSSPVSLTIEKDTPIIVLGTSREPEEIDGQSVYWHRVSAQTSEMQYSVGWVLGKYLEMEDVHPAVFRVLDTPQKDGRQQLIIAYEVDGTAVAIEPLLGKLPHQDFYTFAIDAQYYDYTDETKFWHYRNIPGSYAWFPETNELRHISYIGSSGEYEQVFFTDDYKYLVGSYGIFAPKYIYAWNLETQEKVFFGNYHHDPNLRGYHNISLHGYTIHVAYFFWTKDSGIYNSESMDDEIEYAAKTFYKNNPKPEIGYYNTIVVICEYDLDTALRRIIATEWTYTM
jgi:hypothetical protein